MAEKKLYKIVEAVPAPGNPEDFEEIIFEANDVEEAKEIAQALMAEFTVDE